MLETSRSAVPSRRSAGGGDARSVGRQKAAAVELGTGSGGSSGRGGAVVRAGSRRYVARRRTPLDGRSHLGLRAHLLRRHLRAGELTQRAPQAVVQRDATRPVLSLDVRRGAEALGRMGQR